MNEIGHRTLDRRHLLKLGAAGLAAAALSRSSVLSSLAAEGQVATPFTLGYSSDGLDSPLTDATTLSSSDAQLIASGVRMHVYAPLSLADSPGCRDVEGMALSVDLQRINGAIYHAWSFANGEDGHASSRADFAVPVDDAGLLLTLEVVDSRSGAEWLPLSLGIDDDGAKLRAGYYAVALPTPTGNLPRWNDYQLRAFDGGELMLVGASGGQAGFPYAVFQIEPA